MRKIIVIFLGLLAIGNAAGFYLLWHERQSPESKPKTEAVTPAPQLEEEIATLREQLKQANWERSWVRYFLQQYASFERLAQYGRADKTTELYHQHVGDFLQIQDVTQKLFCPPALGANPDQNYLYFGARMLALPPVGEPRGVPDMIVMSYLGGQTYLHGRPLFDAFLSAQTLAASTPDKVVDMSKSAGLLASFLARGKSTDDLLAQPNGYFRPLAVSSLDLDGDGRRDFILGRSLYLARWLDRETGTLSPDMTPIDLGGETIFLEHQGKPYLMTLAGSDLLLQTWGPSGLKLLKRFSISQNLPRRVPFILVSLPASGTGMASFGVRAEDQFFVYSLDRNLDMTQRVAFSGLQPGEVTAGGFGRFVSKENDDFWLSQPLWKNGDGAIVGRIVLISGDRIQEQNGGTVEIDQFAAFRLQGSRKYTDYDGIGTSLSLYAGDIDGDGLPDFSFSGHRHMNEAGAMFVLPGRAVASGSSMTVESPSVVKILGKRVSQLAPPFQHWDAADINGDGQSDIIVSADNDLCAGLNAGALYVLDGKLITSEWARKHPPS